MNNQNKRYNLMYKHFNPRVIAAVKKTIKENRIFKKSFVERYKILNELKKELCEIYNIKSSKIPHLLLISNSDGMYNHLENTIYLNQKLSLITFLHEFKHFLQVINNKPNSEDIARGYSLSLFYQASPKHFNRAFNKGLIIHQKP